MPAEFIEFTNDGTRAELVRNPPLTPKDVFTYQYYYSACPYCNTVGTTVQLTDPQINRLRRNNGLKILDARDQPPT